MLRNIYKLFFVLILYFGMGKVFAYQNKECEISKFTNGFHSRQYSDKDLKLFYKETLTLEVNKLKDDLGKTLLCFSPEGKELRNRREHFCSQRVPFLKEQVKRYFSEMKVSLMIIQESRKIFHPILEENSSFFYEKTHLSTTAQERGDFENIYGDFLKIKTPRGRRNSWKENSGHREKKDKIRKKYKKKYFDIIKTWPFLLYIKSIENISEGALELTILHGLSKHFNMLKKTLKKITSEDDDDFFLNQEASFNLFLSSIPEKNYEVCHFIENKYDELRWDKYEDIAIKVIAPVAASIGSCIAFTPVGCVVVSLTSGLTATAYDIFSSQKKLKTQYDISFSGLNSPEDISQALDDSNSSIYYSPLFLLEVFVAIKIAKKLRSH